MTGQTLVSISSGCQHRSEAAPELGTIHGSEMYMPGTLTVGCEHRELGMESECRREECRLQMRMVQVVALVLKHPLVFSVFCFVFDVQSQLVS